MSQPTRTTEEILHWARSSHEGRHLNQLFHAFSKWTLASSGTVRMAHGPDSYHQVWNCFNKSFPVYFLGPPQEFDMKRFPVKMAVMAQIHLLLYEKWFTPYQSIIEWGRFLAHLVDVPDFPFALPGDQDMGQVLQETQRLSRGLSDEMREAWEEADQEETAGENAAAKEPQTKRSDVYVCQPLFRAVAVALVGSEYTYESTRNGGVANSPALVVATGVEDGLSAPIDLLSTWRQVRHDKGRNNADDPPFFAQEGSSAHAIRIPFSEAIDLMIHLENREMAAFGIRPDPIQSVQNIEARYKFDRLGYEYQVRGVVPEEALRRPSSEWVDPQVYKQWSGPGRDREGGIRWQSSSLSAIAWSAGLRFEEGYLELE